MADVASIARLEARCLAIGYGRHVLVRGVDLCVRPGQVVTLVGPNGAGKSTLLKTLSGDLAPLGGELLCEGRPYREMSVAERAKMVSVLTTDHPRTELMTAADVVSAGRHPYTGRLGILSEADRAHVAAVMELIGIQGLASCDFMELSDGQRQRVLIARAICQDARIMLLDEPTSYLDIRHQIDVLRALRRHCAERGTCMVMSLHDLSLARQVSDCMVGIKDGRVACQGNPDDLCVPAVMNALFDLRPNSFDPRTGEIMLGLEALGREPSPDGGHRALDEGCPCDA